MHFVFYNNPRHNHQGQHNTYSIYRGRLFTVDVPRLRNQPAAEFCQITPISPSAPSPAAWSSTPWGWLRCPRECTVGAVQYTFFSLGWYDVQAVKLLITLTRDVESNPGLPKIYMWPICSQCITNNKKYKGSVLCISCKDWVHTTCTNTKQYTNTWTCTKCNAQATPPVTTPLALSTTNTTHVRPTITPHPTMQDNSTSNCLSHTQRPSHTSTPTLNRAPRSTQTTQQTRTPSRTPTLPHTDPPQVHLLWSNQSPPPTLFLTHTSCACARKHTKPHMQLPWGNQTPPPIRPLTPPHTQAPLTELIQRNQIQDHQPPHPLTHHTHSQHRDIRPLLQPNHYRHVFQTTPSTPLPTIEQTPEYTT